MKKSLLWLLSVFLFVFPICAAAQNNSQLEKDVLSEINRVRTNPAAYAKWMEDNRYNLPYKTLPDKTKVIDEAAKVLKSTAPLSPLHLSSIAHTSAKFHVDDQLPTGKFSHTGTDGSSVDERLRRFGELIGAYGENAIAMNPNERGIVDAKGIVLAWVIDDRMGNHGHRKIILDRNYQLAGVACGKYSASRIYPDYTLCVVDFAQQLQSARKTTN